MQIKVNGEARELPHNTSLAELISQLDLAAERVAIEHNHAVVRRAHWPSTFLREGDRVEIVHFVGGGRTEDWGRSSAGSSSERILLSFSRITPFPASYFSSRRCKVLGNPRGEG